MDLRKSQVCFNQDLPGRFPVIPCSALDLNLEQLELVLGRSFPKDVFTTIILYKDPKFWEIISGEIYFGPVKEKRLFDYFIDLDLGTKVDQADLKALLDRLKSVPETHPLRTRASSIAFFHLLRQPLDGDLVEYLGKLYTDPEYVCMFDFIRTHPVLKAVLDKIVPSG